MAKIDYRCTQYGECEKADNREVITLEAGQEPVCPNSDCEKPLTKVSDAAGAGRSMPPMKLIVGAGGLVALVAAAILLWPSSMPPKVNVEDALVDVWPWLKGG
jgi:hypothetical protein